MTRPPTAPAVVALVALACIGAAAPSRVASPWDEEDRAAESAVCPPAARRLLLGLLAASTLVRSPYEGSTANTPAVVQPPRLAPPEQAPNPGPGPGVTGQTPEPPALLAAAVGSGLTLLAWLRGWRRRR